MSANFFKSKKISGLQRILSKIRYNLILQVIRNKLVRIGFEFTPYYLYKQGADKIDPPEIKGDFADLTTEFLNIEDIKTIGKSARGYSEKTFMTMLENGKKCYGLKHKGKIAAFVWIDFDECNFKPERFKLKNNEAYLYSLYTMESHRGKNIAPYLAYNCYKVLSEKGKDTFYSITECLNFSAIKYKKKLAAEKLKLVLYIRLFKNYYRSFILKTYK
jgi:ribosomal protein S18 acetylase RimI-like enzyme